MIISQLRLVLKVIKKNFLLISILLLIAIFIFLTILKNSQKIDEDIEDVNIDFLKDKLFKLQRSHFLNEPLNQKNDVNINSIEITQHGTLDHKKILNNQTVKNIDFLKNQQNCRNSIQGKLLIVDERGYVCERYQLTSGGCCDFKTFKLERFLCKTCSSNNCCSIYEYCISCCLDSNKKSLLQKVLTQQSILLNKGINRGIQALFASVTDHFELCLAKCRTSSQSVQHENSYKNPSKKYCFGLYKEEDKSIIKTKKKLI